MAAMVVPKTSGHKKHGSTKLLRRPIAPPPPPAPKQNTTKVSTSSSHKFLRSPEQTLSQTRCVPSAASIIDSQEDIGQYMSPTPSFESDIQGQLDRRYPTPQNTPHSPLKKHVTKVNPTPELAPQTDLKFILESRYKIMMKERPKTFEAKSLVKPVKPRGPACFPLREPKRLPEIRPEFLYLDADDPRYHEHTIPEFTLEDFTIDLKDVRPMYQRSRLKEAVLSKQNFKKLTTLFATFVDKPKQTEIHTIQLKGEDIPEVIPRVPQQQLLLEMALIIRNQMRQIVNDEVLTLMPNGNTLGATRTPDPSPVRQLMPAIEGSHGGITDQAIFGGPISKYFQGGRRTNSPFSEVDSSATINPSELAILDCLVNGGLALSLKAHFIAIIPEVSPLVKTLTYLNLSFNDFMVFPPEVLTLRNLRVLKLRNNPLKEVPQAISKLTHLSTLVLSFCMITNLPQGLFQLPLQFLDVSYNKLTRIPSEIKKLKKLRALNVEGNQLTTMPCSALKLRRLRYLRVYNNFMHPVFWRENSHNEPQRLTDLSAVVFTQYELEERYQLPPEISKILQSYTTCDCCQGAVFGPGLRIIRPCSQAFGVRKLPFLFICCSPHCRDWFMESVESLTSILYDDDGGDEGGGQLVLRDPTPEV